ncbi:MAG: hypothetical protein ABGU93_05475 [Acetobacterium sp.]|uniref:hypothetical protein n=1 Tax=Acetobacterium sp. TaxID=1872094 RepID=UPI003241E231
MEKTIKRCPLCDGVCRLSGAGKKHAVVCSSCGNESPPKTTPAAAINSHNQTGYRLHKQLL